MGGTRFVGKSLVEKLLSYGHDLTLFTRGINAIPTNVKHFTGDRNQVDALNQLKGYEFDIVIDSSGRKKNETKSLLDVIGIPSYRYIYISSAGVYNNNEVWPVDESSPVDPQSRHIEKYFTEQWLKDQNIPFTSFRPTYIYGPGNYNPIETWFFDRILNNRTIPIPGNGETITQLGHVSDLSDAIILSMDNNISINKVYNCSSKKGITFNGLLHMAAMICGIDKNNLNIHYFDPETRQGKARKLFPLRLTHFLTDTNLIESDLCWQPKIELREGLLDSFTNDYIKNKRSQPDFSLDDLILNS